MAKGKSKGKKKVRESEVHDAEKANASESKAAQVEMPEQDELYDLAVFFKIFADTTRIKILYALKGEGKCVSELAELVGVSQSAVSHHLRDMRQVHLVRYERDGRNVRYALADTGVEAILAQGLSHIEQ